ncbi:hypothetical protein ABZZ74_01135 [Streptomyces sp. NPDC006476]|uniref:hypothetical protein n=1 Tax=Streptomyces sp. NPDC006476 TaxID=3157175 RepID=UPI0033BC6AD9
MTADALHTQRAHAHFLVEQKDAHYAFPVKKNQPIPYAQTAKFYDRSHGNGRLETRTVQVLTSPPSASTSRTPRRSSATGPA